MADEFPADAVDLAARLAEELERRHVEYAIGGAIAYGAWAVPRGTLDVDVNVFVDPPQLAPVFDALDELGCKPDRSRDRARAERDGIFEAWLGAFRIDVFTPSTPFSADAARTRTLHRLGDRDVFILSAESIAVFKLLFFRSKDLVDLERLLGVRAGAFDTTWVRDHVAALVGEDDPRISRWDALVQAHSR